MRRPAGALPLLGGVLTLTAAIMPSCANCTDEGCGNLVTFHVAADLQAGQPYRVESCVAETCQSGTVQVSVQVSETGGAVGQVVDGLVLDPGSDTIYLSFPEVADWEGTHPVTLTVRDDSAERHPPGHRRGAVCRLRGAGDA